MDDRGPVEEFRRTRRSMWRMRWLLVGLSGVLAVALVASGAVVIGVIVGVMAVVRGVVIFRWQRHGSFREGYGSNLARR